MRPRFADVAKIKREATKRATSDSDWLERWWRRKYIPGKGKPWGERTPGGILREMFFDLAVELHELEESDGLDATQQDRLTKLEAVFQEDTSNISIGQSGDPWLDDWDGEDMEEIDMSDLEGMDFNPETYPE